MKRFLKIICCIALVIFIVMYVVFGYIPVFGELISEMILTRYAHTYGISDGWIHTDIDWYFTGCYDWVECEGLSYSTHKNIIIDWDENERVDKDAETDFLKVASTFSDDFRFRSFGMSVKINAFDFEKRAHNISFTVWNTEELTPVESRKRAVDVAWQILREMGDDYHFRQLYYGYYDKNGSLVIDADNYGYKELSYEDIEENIYVDERISLEYIDWKKEHGFD
ncbi:MAG: hypothetical protein E7218_08380 [Anaerofustis stercorihominis]|nr:hypothetical protein [Anaerofustis stercorihominis]